MKFKVGDKIVLVKDNVLSFYIEDMNLKYNTNIKYDTTYVIDHLSNFYYYLDRNGHNFLLEEKEVKSSKEYLFDQFMKKELS